MQFKSLAAVLFASMAIAAPAETDSNQDIDDFTIPQSIAVVLATAVPSSFWAEATNTANFLSQVEEGFVSNSWPTWYSSLPESVKAYVTTAVGDYYPTWASSVSAEATSVSGSISSSLASATGSSSGVSTTTASTTVLTTTSSSASPTGSDASSSGSASGSASGSPSGSAGSSTSDGGAAPTGVALSFAGAVGVLGVALAL
ncbi:uncharacterized protein N7506_002848 [Penicillium brevicompactum]|uniref:uncharacterized protein n=1 Tax=Penicillium brevicompactum TaxID=5074 RepID=UPI00253FADAD|nr:uncharacterized protein N7506_002848 [Penicillium brevicompactum]KAJ5343024.1 hypothetical protein N7506_002848 [Penicillium brevicompactum]